MIDLSQMPVVDAHCHSYLKSPRNLGAKEFARHASILSVQPDFLSGKFAPKKTQLNVSRNRLATMYQEQPFYRYLIRLLSTQFGCNPDAKAVAEARNLRVSDFDSYVRDLFEDAKIRGLVLDGGYPSLTSSDLRRFPAKAVRIFRIETFINELLVRHKTFKEFLADYESGIREAIKRQGYVGLKSIIAYRTGLWSRRVTTKEAKKDFQDAEKGRAELAWYGPKVKQLRDFLIVRAMEIGVDLNVPMQIHTGVGDYDIALDQCDPALIYDLLKDDILRHATVVLVHSGFPNNQNAAFMSSVLPNVFLDFSLTIPFMNPISHNRMMEILQIAPSSKIMYGSDGFNLPELFWLSVKVARNALGKCFAQFLEEGVFNEDEIRENSKRILFENANQLYKLGLD